MLSQLIVQILVIAIAALCGEANAACQANCTSPVNEHGICIHIQDCEYLLKMLNSTDTTAADRDFLKKSQCGFDNSQKSLTRRVLVCCPKKDCNDSVRADPKRITTGDQLPSFPTCGEVFSGKIIGGNKTKLDEFPWMALINYKKPYNNFGFHCGGTLINSRYILTAGHCVKNPNMSPTWSLYSVRLGEWDTRTDPDCVTDSVGHKECAPPHMDVLVESSMTHELYVPGSIDQFHDIALLRMAELVTFTDFIRPICLPLDKAVRESMFLNTAMDVAGWGVTETLEPSPVKLKIVVNVWNISECQDTYRSYQLRINSSQLCAGGEEGKDSCRGDSGGPLMVAESVGNRFIYFIAGVVSYGPKPCGLQGWPGVYSRVGYFVDWVQHNLQP